MTHFYVTPRQITEVVPVSEDKIRRQIKDGALKARKLGRAWLIPASEVERVYGIDPEVLR